MIARMQRDLIARADGRVTLKVIFVYERANPLAVGLDIYPLNSLTPVRWEICRRLLRDAIRHTRTPQGLGDVRVETRGDTTTLRLRSPAGAVWLDINAKSLAAAIADSERIVGIGSDVEDELVADALDAWIGQVTA